MKAGHWELSQLVHPMPLWGWAKKNTTLHLKLTGSYAAMISVCTNNSLRDEQERFRVMVLKPSPGTAYDVNLSIDGHLDVNLSLWTQSPALCAPTINPDHILVSPVWYINEASRTLLEATWTQNVAGCGFSVLNWCWNKKKMLGKLQLL